jgi:hypothetical protein
LIRAGSDDPETIGGNDETGTTGHQPRPKLASTLDILSATVPELAALVPTRHQENRADFAQIGGLVLRGCLVFTQLPDGRGHYQPENERSPLSKFLNLTEVFGWM